MYEQAWSNFQIEFPLPLLPLRRWDPESLSSKRMLPSFTAVPRGDWQC